MREHAIFLLLIFAALFFPGLASALEAPENYTAAISAVDFYPSGAKFTFTVEPQGSDGDFRAVIPGAFTPESIRLVNPETVYGDIYAASFTRTKWTPPQLEALRLQAEEQARTVSDLSARKSALEQTLSLLKNSNPDKSKPEELLRYIRDAQNVRLEAENELALLKAELSREQEKLRALNTELQGRMPDNDSSYTVVTGQAGGTVYIEAFTRSASWKPRYTLNLATASGAVEVKMYIRASQKTGLDYTGNMTLHTKTPGDIVTVPEIPPLKVGIKPKEEVVASMSTVSLSRTNRQFKSARAAMPEAEMFMAEDAAAEYDSAPAAPAPRAPAVRETLADRTLDIEGTLAGDGTEREFEVIMSDLYLDSRIELTLIPEQRPEAWIVASMDEKNEHLIPGEAELRVDFHPSGKIYLQEYGIGQRRIPFGYANQITAKKERLVEKTGVQWFSGVFTSGYKLEITNGTKDEQTVIVRDRLPIPTDDKIKLEVKRIEPKEKERDKENRLTWEITIPAGATVPIVVDYTLSYPSGEELQYK
ncbi:MAG: DUF4139 domain-containing protein [Synergistaceae bacterium]|nr:DUF4139 domain-containing protein [Synergistaceae bacterium]